VRTSSPTPHGHRTAVTINLAAYCSLQGVSAKRSRMRRAIEQIALESLGMVGAVAVVAEGVVSGNQILEDRRLDAVAAENSRVQNASLSIRAPSGKWLT